MVDPVAQARIPQRFAGVEPVGPASKPSVTIDVRFPQPFSAPPVVVVTAIPEADDFNMAYAAIVLEVRVDGFAANFGVTNDDSGWDGSPSLSWLATENSNV